MAKYKVKGTDILYNGKLFAEGKTINLEDDEAKQLATYLELIPEKVNKKQGEQGKPAKETKNLEETSISTPAVQGGNK